MNDDSNPNRDDPADDFWGTTPDWSDTAYRPTRSSDASRPEITGRIRNLWSSAMSAGAEPTREHGVFDATAPRPESDVSREPTSEIDRSMFDDLDTEIDVPPWVGTGAADITGRGTRRASFDRHDDLPSDRGFDGAENVGTDQNLGTDENLGTDDDMFAFAPVSVAERHDSRRRGLDPLLVRVGAVAVAASLMIPLAIGLTSDDSDDSIGSAAAASASGDIASDDSATAPSTTPSTEPPATTATEIPPTSASTAPDVVSAADDDAVDATIADESDESDESESVELVESASGAFAVDESENAQDADTTDRSATSDDDGSDTIDDAATVDEPAERTNDCAVDYEVRAGDYWIRLAESAGVDLPELLDANGATSDTPLYPGQSICLPAGSSTPSTPSATDAPTTTEPPTTTAAPTTTDAPTNPSPTTTDAPPTTAAPTTTEPPTTTAPASDGRGVEQIIRDVWPDELEDRALEIAFRESRYDPRAKNYCCYGVFQIYWEVHRSWLADLGITNDQQLYDPETNTRAAYALYQRSGGWGPWGF